MKISGIGCRGQGKKISFKQYKKKDSSFKEHGRPHHTHKKNRLEQASITQLKDFNLEVATVEDSLSLLKRSLSYLDPILCSLGNGVSRLTEDAKSGKKFNQESLHYLTKFSEKLDSINNSMSTAKEQFDTLMSQLAPLSDTLSSITDTVSQVFRKKQPQKPKGLKDS